MKTIYKLTFHLENGSVTYEADRNLFVHYPEDSMIFFSDHKYSDLDDSNIEEHTCEDISAIWSTLDICGFTIRHGHNDMVKNVTIKQYVI